jgi:hypothetical protein
MLKDPKDKRGYTRKELEKIRKRYNIKKKVFYDALGVNTCMLNEKGEALTYKCDVERALYNLDIKDGKFHLWD